jgi:hypothetical protein
MSKKNRPPSTSNEDPVLAMLGVGQPLWDHEAGDRFVERLRSEKIPNSAIPRQSADAAEDLP